MNSLVEFYKYKNKKYSKTLLLLFIVFIIALPTSGDSTFKILMSLASMCALAALVISFKSFWLEFKKEAIDN